MSARGTGRFCGAEERMGRTSQTFPGKGCQQAGKKERRKKRETPKPHLLRCGEKTMFRVKKRPYLVRGLETE